MKIAIDLALRKIGVTVLDDTDNVINFLLFDSDPKKVKDENLLILNTTRITNLIAKYYWKDYNEGLINNLTIIMEGLSFNSKSASIDLIAANHWQIRSYIKSAFEKVKLVIVPPKSWMKEILKKEVFAELTSGYPIIRAKKGFKLDKDQIKANNKSKAIIRKISKQYIFEQVPEELQKRILDYIKKEKLPEDSKFDLADSYFLSKFGSK